MTLLNKGWKFCSGKIKNAQNADFDDSAWKNIDLPHDWVISQPFDRGKPEGWTHQNMQGFFSWEGVCWYRKVFTLSKIEAKEIYIYFAGAYRNSVVYINGREAGGRANGYSSFEIDITEFAQEGNNVIAVYLDNGCEPPDRWYSGSGIYRDVWLKILPSTHIKTWGVQIKTELSKNNKQADISVLTTIVNKKQKTEKNDHKVKGIVWVKLLGPNGKYVAEITGPFECPGGEETVARLQAKILNPVLWSAENPSLYRAFINLEINGKTDEPLEFNIGIRSIEIEYKKGMKVNGEKVKLKGVCLHHDAGITGSAYYESVWRRRLNILKSIGCNAIRTSHNPPAEEFLNLCDETGFYVIDECFDKWVSGYYSSHYEKDSKRDLTDFILRDRNHPSVFMWSIGNEVENQGTDGMIAIQKRLVDIVKELDSRPVTCALAPHANPRTLVGSPPEELVKLTKKLAKDVDVLGLNYHEPLYQHYTKGIDKPIIGTECYEYYSSVGTNFEDVCDKNPWQFVLENDNVIGQFIWAGIDYLGEAPWPCKGWTGSILDICGFMKPNAYFRKSIWSNEPFVYLAFYDQYMKRDYARGRWSFPQMSSNLNQEYFERRTVTACVFTNCEEAELWINGKKRGLRRREDFKNGIIEWTIEYTTDDIEVKGITDGRQECSYALKKAGESKKIKLIADKSEIDAGDIAHIEVNITDKNGILCAYNNESLVEFSLTGDAVFLGACSGDLTQNMGFTLPKAVISGGKALAMIRIGDTPGIVELCAISERLDKAQIKFKVK
ncbi:MAG: DUF4982 domain-containing protein [Treponema sp.]|nr:DUF4982 domain-containing protein [Treponema sp.]